MHHLDDVGGGQPLLERRIHAGDQRVDQQDLIADGHLHQGQLRPVGAFANEFCIQADARRSRCLQAVSQLGGWMIQWGT